jgi:outer membrane protein assembly factor BamB
MHTAYDMDKNGIRIMCSANPSDGGIDSSAAGVRKVTVSGTSITSEFIYNRQPVAAPDESIWRCKLLCGCEHGQPVFCDGDLFVATMDYGFTTEAGVYRICGETGEIKWFFNTKNSVKGGIDVQAGRVYLQDCGGMLYCLDAKDGSLLWQRELPLNATCYTRMNVLARCGVVVAGRPRQVFGCDMNTGEVLWSYSHRKGGDTPAQLIWDESRQRVILCGLWYMTAALDIKTGEFAWQETEHPANLRNNTPCISGNILYGSGQNWVYCHELATGKLIRKEQKDFFMDSHGKAVVEGDVIYCSTGDKGVVAMDKNTFDVLRFYSAGPAAISTAPYLYGGVQTVEGSPVIDGDRLIFAASDGMLRIYNKDTAELQKAVSIGAPCITTPIVAGDAVYTADFDGHVTKFRL